jgi:cell division protein FtsX
MIQLFVSSLSRGFSALLRDIVGTIWASFFLGLLFFLMFILIFLSIGTQKTTISLQKQVSLVFFFLPEAEEYQITNMQTELESLKKTEKISDFKVVSKEDALKEFTEKYPEKTVFLDRYNLENPLRTSFEVSPKQMSVQEITNFFGSENFNGIIDKALISENDKERARAEKVLEALNFIQIGIYVLSGIFLFAILIVISTAISHSLALARREIFIMHLVGAMPSFIRTPFLIESSFIAGIGIIIGFFFWWIGRSAVIQHLLNITDDPEIKVALAENINEIMRGFFDVFPWVVLMALVSITGVSFFTIGRYLSKKNLLREFS